MGTRNNIIGGFKYIGSNQLLLQLMIYSLAVALLAMPFRNFIPAYAKDIYCSTGS